MVEVLYFEFWPSLLKIAVYRFSRLFTIGAQSSTGQGAEFTYVVFHDSYEDIALHCITLHCN